MMLAHHSMIHILLSLRSKQRLFLVAAMVVLSLCGFNVFSQTPDSLQVIDPTIPRRHGVSPVPVHITPALPDSLMLPDQPVEGEELAVTPFEFNDSTLREARPDTVSVQLVDGEWEPREVTYTPDPVRAVWLSALCPGLGQVYNRRYWKLPLVIGGYMGLVYATNWNNTMLADYTRAYADLTDNDPNTKSYMDFFHGNVSESSLDKQWLTNTFKARKDFFRRNRDLCIISMVGVYLLAMLDAYVDASLAHFDISPQLSMNVAPTLVPDTRGSSPGVGLHWAFNF